MPVSKNFLSPADSFIPDGYLTDSLPSYTPISRLSESMSESMRMMASIQQLRETLPGIDCGACGSPTCRAFAEDVVKGLAGEARKCVVLEQRKFQKKEESGDDCR